MIVRHNCDCCAKPIQAAPIMEHVSLIHQSPIPVGFNKFTNEGDFEIVYPLEPFYPPDGPTPFVRTKPRKLENCYLYSQQICQNFCYNWWQFFIIDPETGEQVWSGFRHGLEAFYENIKFKENEIDPYKNGGGDLGWPYPRKCIEVIEGQSGPQSFGPNDSECTGKLIATGGPNGQAAAGAVFRHQECFARQKIEPFDVCVINYEYPPFRSDRGESDYDYKENQSGMFFVRSSKSINGYNTFKAKTKYRFRCPAPATAYCKVWYDIITELYIQKPYDLDPQGPFIPIPCQEFWIKVDSVPEELEGAGISLEVEKRSAVLTPTINLNFSQNPQDSFFESGVMELEILENYNGVWLEKDYEIKKWSFVEGYEPPVEVNRIAGTGFECQGFPVLDPKSVCSWEK